MTLMGSNVYVALGTQIRRARESRGATQTDLGQHVQLSRSSIANIEAGRQIVNVHQLLLISEFLQVVPSTLLPALTTAKAENEPLHLDKTIIERAIMESIDYDQDD